MSLLQSKPLPERAINRNQFLNKIADSQHIDQKGLDRIQRAFDVGQKYHKGQKRASGVDYFRGHCVHVALILHQLDMPTTMIIAGLLHDILEDTEMTYEELEKQFGAEIATLVDGVTKLSPLKYRYYKRHVSSLRKFFIAVASDARVIIIKICDRLHNLQTLHFLPEDKRQRIAEESMLIHAQLAQKLHMHHLSQIINDLAFAYVLPEECQRIKRLRKSALAKAAKTIKSVYRQGLVALHGELGYTPVVDRRVKGVYSLYRKLLSKNWNIEAVYDLFCFSHHR